MNNSQVPLDASQEVKIHLHTERGEVKPRSDHARKMGVKTTNGNDPPKDAQQLSEQLVVSDEVTRPACPAGASVSPSLESNEADEETEWEEEDAVGGSVEEKQEYSRGRVHAVHQ